MTTPRFLTRAHLAMWLAAAALFFAAVSPTLNALRIQGQPQLFAELCTRMGMVKVPVSDTDAPLHERTGKHGVECALCLPAGTWLALAGDGIPAFIAQSLHDPVPTAEVHAGPALAAHTVALSRAPPARI